MGCNISRPELRGRGRDPGLLSFNNHNADEAPTGDPIYAKTQPAVSTKFVIKQIVGRNSDVSTGKGKKDFVLGGSNELLLPEKDKEGLTDLSPPHPPPSHHVSSLHDPATRKSPENPPKHPKTNHDHTGNDVVNSEGRGAVIPKFDGPLWIASPSFREYCHTAPPDPNSDDDDVDDGFRISVAKDNNNDVENRSHSENVRHLTKDTEMNRQNHTDVSKDTEMNRQNHTVVSKDTEVAKNDENSIQRNDPTIQGVKRRRNLRKMLTLHRPAAVRNLFSVGACYNPLASSTHNGARKTPHSKPV